MSQADQAELEQFERLAAAAAARGDRVAFDQLVRRTARLVWASVFLRVRNRSAADEITQETYLAAWRNVRRLSDVTKFRPWLLQIAANAVVDHVRRNTTLKRRAETSYDEAMDRAAAKEADPSDAAELSEQQSRVLDAMANLPEQYQQVLALRFFGGADYAAMEKLLSLSNGSLRGLLHRGLDMLREKLGDDA